MANLVVFSLIIKSKSIWIQKILTHFCFLERFAYCVHFKYMILCKCEINEKNFVK